MLSLHDYKTKYYKTPVASTACVLNVVCDDALHAQYRPKHDGQFKTVNIQINIDISI